jgi:arginine N-succinyltransferase
MAFRVRPARAEDFQAIYEMAKLTGGGFTNLPADKAALVDKLAHSQAAFAKTEDAPGDDMYMFVLEDPDAGLVRGTCQVFSMVGQRQPFYSYRLSALTQYSPELNRTFRAEMLSLCTDFEGASEVGGLFLHPAERAGGLGMLLARSRYLFIKLHRARFANKVLAELRGVIDESGGSPFWDAIAGRFFGMGFQEADSFNAVHGTQFISDLMPKTPIYTAMLAEGARSVMGVPHPSGRAALRMLEGEGFRHEGYVDIFDGGPTVACPTDQIRTILASRQLTFAGTYDEESGPTMMLAAGHLDVFACCYGRIHILADDQARLDPASASLLGLQPGDTFLAVAR